MDITVSCLQSPDRELWESLYCAYAEFYEMPITSLLKERIG